MTISLINQLSIYSMSETTYMAMHPLERRLLVGKLVDLLIYDSAFCEAMIKVVELKEEMGVIKGKFFDKEEKLADA